MFNKYEDSSDEAGSDVHRGDAENGNGHAAASNGVDRSSVSGVSVGGRNPSIGSHQVGGESI